MGRDLHMDTCTGIVSTRNIRSLPWRMFGYPCNQETGPAAVRPLLSDDRYSKSPGKLTDTAAMGITVPAHERLPGLEVMK